MNRSVERFSDVQKYFRTHLSLQNLFVDFKKSKISKKVGVGKPMASAPPYDFQGQRCWEESEFTDFGIQH